MRCADIKTYEDSELYIGNSKSWKKAYRASRARYEIIQKYDNKYSSVYDGCEFCIVHDNGRFDPHDADCPSCPTGELCNKFTEERSRLTPKEQATLALKYLEEIKPKIFGDK